MCSEVECGICYQVFNTGRRCPRELECKHSFCESCLVALSKSPIREIESRNCSTLDKKMVCPFCRHITHISRGISVRKALRVDESVFERILATSVLDDSNDEDESTKENEEATVPDRVAVNADLASVSRGGRFQRSMRRAWKKFIVNSEQGRTINATNCVTNEDMRDLALMSSFFF